MFNLRSFLLYLTAALLSQSALAHTPHACPESLPDTPSMTTHLQQADLINGKMRLSNIFDAGERLFNAVFNVCDGQGRPASTGTGEKRSAAQPPFVRTSGPDSSACAGCHSQPRSGGGGDFVANVFVLAQAKDPVSLSVAPEDSNERNTLGMFGAGPIEMLAREMTKDLKIQAVTLPDGNHRLTSKGVVFEISKRGGQVISARGIDPDLVIKPFHQAGVVVSLRQFTVNAFNHHHGMQAEERFDLNPAKGNEPDFDEDGVSRELTVGDITATTLWQAQLGTPGRVLPKDRTERRQAKRGEVLFVAVGCGSCHVPAMALDTRFFSEPNPYNPADTFRDGKQRVQFDLTEQGDGRRLEKGPNGSAIVRAYTDLKRHNLCDPLGRPGAIRHFCNEHLAQGRPDQDGQPGQEFFLTRKLWDVGNSAPYGHRGDLTTICEAILAHGGEARAIRDQFAALPRIDQSAIVSFLRTLQILPTRTSNKRVSASD